MDNFDKDKFESFMLDNEVVGFFEKPVRLKSGRESNWYVNWRKVSSDVYLIDELSDFLISFVCSLGLNPDIFYGVPEGATKLGIVATYKWAKMQKTYAPGSHSLSMGRAKLKEHGMPEDRYFVGEPQGRVLVVEDVTTTGGSLMQTIENLKKTSASVVAAVGLTNRLELRDDGLSVSEAMHKIGVPYHSLCEAHDFLPRAYKMLAPGDEIGRAVEEEFQKFGVRQVRLT